MPPATRSVRRLNTRTIMGVLQDDDDQNASKSNGSNNVDGLVSNLDKANPDHIRLLLNDIEAHLKQKQEILTAEMNSGKQEQQQVHFSGMLKMNSSVKKMTVRDFNSKYNCDLLQILKDVTSLTGRKRNHQVLETPAHPNGREDAKAPATTRTVRRGEPVFSMNGSPVDQTDEGALVATVTKKRRGNASAAFDINVGEGRVINLADPGTMKHLDDSMKSTAMSQLKVLQDQMESLMAKLAN